MGDVGKRGAVALRDLGARVDVVHHCLGVLGELRCRPRVRDASGVGPVEGCPATRQTETRADRRRDAGDLHLRRLIDRIGTIERRQRRAIATPRARPSNIIACCCRVGGGAGSGGAKALPL